MNKTNIEIIRGDSLSLVVHITDADGQEIIVGDNGQVYFTMKSSYDDEEYEVQKTLDNGIEYDEDIGYVITLNTNDTNTLDYGKHVFDVEYKLNDFVKTVVIGTIKLNKEVTLKGNE